MKVKTTFAVLALAGLALALPASSAAESSRVIEVEPGESIQAAIDAADPGTTIEIEEGTYKESLQVSKDGIKLVGEGRDETHIVPPDPLVPGQGCVSEGPPVTAIGICVGDPSVEPPVRIDGVRISHLSVTGFNGMGIFLFGVDGGTVKHVNASDDGEYGIFANNSSGTRLYRNITNNDGEAGIYVGDSANADALVKKNAASGSTLGIFIRDAANGLVVKNKTFGNCVGILFLNTEDGSPAEQNDVANWVALKNRVTENNKACAPSDEAPPLSGIGIAVLGGVDISLIANHVLDNKAGANPTAFVGGISVQASPFFATPKPSTGTRVAFNTALGNDPDLFWDGAGDGNVFDDNECRTSDPAGLCDEAGDEPGSGEDDGDDDRGSGKSSDKNHDDDDDDEGDKRKNGHQKSKQKSSKRDRDDD